MTYLMQSKTGKILLIPGIITVILGIILVITYTVYANFNWDETNELSHIYAWQNGHQLHPLRNGMLYLGFLLQFLPLIETDILIVGRFLCLFAGLIPLAWFLSRILGQIGGRTARWFFLPVLLFHSAFNETVYQYRNDIFLILFFTGSFYFTLVKARRRPPLLWPAVFLALGMFFNTKMVYQVALLCGLWGLHLLFRLADRRPVLSIARRYILIGLISALIFTGLTLFHCLVHDIPIGQIIENIRGNAKTGFASTQGDTYRDLFLEIALFKNLNTLVFIAVGLLGAGYVVYTNRKLSSPRFQLPVYLVLFCAGWAVITRVHQGTYKYLIIDFWPLYSVLGGLALYLAWQLLQKLPWWAGLVPVLLAMNALTQVSFDRFEKRNNFNNKNQKQSVSIIKAVFPEEVPYADGFGGISSYPNLVRFFSNKRYLRYKDGHEPLLLEDDLKVDKPVFIFETSRFSLDKMRGSDLEYFKKNYYEVIGNLRVYAVKVKKGAAEKRKVDIGGHYYPEQGTRILVDGQPVVKGINLVTNKEYTFLCEEKCNGALIRGDVPYYTVTRDVFIPRGQNKVQVDFTASYHCPANEFCKSKKLKIRKKRVLIRHGVWLKKGTYEADNRFKRPRKLTPLGLFFMRKLHNE